MAIRAPDGANNAYSAFIFLKILSIQSKWSEWSERSRKVLLEPLDSQVRIIMEVNSSLGNVVWCGVLQSGLVWCTKIARMNWVSYGTMSWLL